MPSFLTLTLDDFLNHPDETIRRSAMSILKRLKKVPRDAPQWIDKLTNQEPDQTSRTLR